MKKELFYSALAKLIKLSILLLTVSPLIAQVKLPSYPDSIFSTYYHQRVTHFKTLPRTTNDIIFIGNSITDGAEWGELFGDVHIKNRGISGDVSDGIIHRLDEIVDRRPAKIFLMIGVNDLARNVSIDSLTKNISWIVNYVQQETPNTKMYVLSLLPVNDHFKKFRGHTDKRNSITEVNQFLKKNAGSGHYTYVDLHTSFCNDTGALNTAYSNDGLHLTGEGYVLWKHLIYPYVYNLESKPSLIPLPQKITWHQGVFALSKCKTIVLKHPSLHKEAVLLQKLLREKSVNTNIVTVPTGEPCIELIEEPIATFNVDEAYKISVTTDKVILSANSTHGMFNSIQTFAQLLRSGVMIDACEITDWPAFSWRGYMVDVGRNFQSVDLLKQQIDIMAEYKLNIFQLHLTEDIAWRIAIKQYPQLTAPENMLRDKGEFYTEKELVDLIAYCNERYVTLVPELDMPGHSAAFSRAMKTDMQSEAGLTIVKNIIDEFCSTYKVPYLHIGADEVKITNKEFVPRVTNYIERHGVKVIGWEPGGNFTENTIRQLWMDDRGVITSSAKIKYIDSRHLYLNHMDPLESVVTIFNRKIANQESGNARVLGGTICLWNDRALANESDALIMNPVYPSVLAFAERSWRGGGRDGWVANVGAPFSEPANTFLEFENRLLDHKKEYFLNLPFPYVRQTSSRWKFFGPYSNKGDLSKAFEPQDPNFDTDKRQFAFETLGGTLVLRHWWHPLIKGLIEQPETNTTWYATTKIWSNAETFESFWIGFNNLSRSQASDSPPAGMWDGKGSAVWINSEKIDPPQWKHAGRKGNLEIPLSDEGYEYRVPIQLKLNRGWNSILVKLPISSFDAPDWQNPVKWMFTMVKAND